MRNANKPCATLLAAVLVFTPMTHAARPLITDDARTVDAKACQVESWVRSNQGSKEYWALPACNFTGNLELTFGGARMSDAEGTQTTDVVLQGKTLFKPLETNGWGIGLAVGVIRHPGDGRHISALYSYIPTSFSFHSDKVFLHTNVGVLRNLLTSTTRVTWGIGTETQLAERAWLIAETFQQEQGRPFFQAGVRYWVVPNRAQIDATMGNRFGSRTDERWFSIGLRLLSPAFLP
jgi:hypothetical protein